MKKKQKEEIKIKKKSGKTELLSVVIYYNTFRLNLIINDVFFVNKL